MRRRAPARDNFYPKIKYCLTCGRLYPSIGSYSVRADRPAPHNRLDTSRGNRTSRTAGGVHLETGGRNMITFRNRAVIVAGAAGLLLTSLGSRVARAQN